MDKHTQELRRNDQFNKARIDRLEAFCTELYDEVRKLKTFVKYVAPENPPVQQKNGSKAELEAALKNVDFIETGTASHSGGGRRKVINN